MNRSEIEEEIEKLQTKIDQIEDDLRQFGVQLSAPSQIAMIARIVDCQADIKQFIGMLDILDFDDIIRGEF